jgi:carboxylate-amine ligase
MTSAGVPTFGVEEEYMFLDARTLEPLAIVDQVHSALHVGAGEAANVQHEFLACQIERSTEVCATREQAEAELTAFRRRVAAVAEDLGALAVSSAFAPAGLRSAVISDTDRYRSIRTTSRALVDEHYVNGLHVHVGVADRAAGLTAMNRIRVWMPALVALSSNSPLQHGADSGFASWRTLHFQRWTTHGCPPLFDDVADYERRLNALIGIGGSIDRAVMSFNIRLSMNHPTIEIRAADAQLEARDSVLLAAIIRAMVSTALDDAELGIPPLPVAPEMLDASLWHAARDGVVAELVDPRSGTLRAAREVIGALLEWTETALLRADDAEAVTAGVDRMLDGGNGAIRQRTAFVRGGMPAVAELLRDSFIDAHSTSPFTGVLPIQSAPILDEMA